MEASGSEPPNYYKQGLVVFVQCKGVNRKGSRCGGGAMSGSDFCGSHNPKHLELNRCSSLTRGGEPCQGGAIKGTDLCIVHTAHVVGVAKVGMGNGIVDVAYREYLKSPQWKIKRGKRLGIDGSACVLCGERRALEVHHVSYSRLGFELMSDLRTLCRWCHQKVTHDEQTIGRDAANAVFYAGTRRGKKRTRNNAPVIPGYARGGSSSS